MGLEELTVTGLALALGGPNLVCQFGDEYGLGVGVKIAWVPRHCLYHVCRIAAPMEIMRFSV